jgi:hypothetical protein
MQNDQQSHYLLSYLINPWSRIFLEKLTGSQLVKKLSAFYGTQKFITAFKVPGTFPILRQRVSVHTPHPTY